MGLKSAWNSLWGIEKKSGPFTMEEINSWARENSEAYPFWNYSMVSKFAFERNVVAYKCIMEVSKAVGGLKWYLVDKTNDTDIKQHPLLDLLARPNKTQGRSAFFQHLQAHKMLDGNGFIEMVGPGVNGSGTPRELWTKRPDWVQVMPSNSQLPASYIYTPGGEGGGSSMTYTVDQISGASRLLHIRSFAPLFESSNMRGLSPVRSAIQQMLAHNEANQWQKNMIKNGVGTSGALVTSEALSEEQIMGMLKNLSDQYMGSKNSGKPMVLTGGLDFKPMSMTPKDADFVNLKNSAARDIAMALGVPPILLHIPGDSTYNNVKDARMAFYEETVLAEARLIRDELNRWLVPMFGKNLCLEIDEDDISALFPRRQLKWQMITQSNFLTINERREAFGYEPIAGDGGNEVFIPSTQVPINVAVDPENPLDLPRIDGGVSGEE